MDLYTLQIFMPAIEAAKSQQTWLPYLSALLTPVVALLGIWIARSQWKTARMKLKLDLFDKRMVVYEAVRHAIGQIMVHGKTSAEVESAYLIGVTGAKWLFDKEMDKYLNEKLWRLISRLHTVQFEQIGAPAEERRQAVEKQCKVMEEMSIHWQSIDSKFYPFLSLGH